MTANEAMQKKAEMRRKALDDAMSKTLLLDEQYEDIKEIDAELSSASVQIISAISLPDTQTKIKEITDRNLFLQSLRKQKLKEHGIPEDYDEPGFECKICSDTGYNGKTFCSCVVKMCAKENYLSSGLGKALLEQTFESFSLKYYESAHRQNMADIFEIAKDYADNFRADGENLLFTGGTGLGKTHLSSAIAQRVIDKGYSVVYDSAQNIFDLYESIRFGKGGGDTSRFMTCDLLIIDDLGSEFCTQYTAAVLYQIINGRLINGKSVILNTNLNGKEIEKRYGERVYSRVLSSFSTCVFTGTDIRRVKLGE